MNLTFYSVTAINPTDEAMAIVNKINSLVASKGDNLYQDRVQAALDAAASAETQAALGLKVTSAGFDMAHEE